jgi:hypothetical protein
MPLVTFTANLQRHAPCPPCPAEGGTVGEALESAFARYPKVRGYVVDEHGALRPHMIVFVDGKAVEDRRLLSDPVTAVSRIHVAQALSGG